MSFKKSLALLMVMSILLGFSGESFVQAKEISKNDSTTQNANQKEIDETAHSLEVIYDDAAVYNEETDTLEFKESILKQKLSSSQYNEISKTLEQDGLLVKDIGVLTPELNQPNWRAKLGSEKKGAYADKCVANEVNNTYGPKGAKAIAELILAQNYQKAAWEIAKRGIKISSNIGNLAGILTKCIAKTNNKFG